MDTVIMLCAPGNRREVGLDLEAAEATNRLDCDWPGYRGVAQPLLGLDKQLADLLWVRRKRQYGRPDDRDRLLCGVVSRCPRRRCRRVGLRLGCRPADRHVVAQRGSTNVLALRRLVSTRACGDRAYDQ